MKSFAVFLFVLCLTGMTGCGGSAAQKPSPAEPEPLIPLFENLGSHHYPVSTSVPLAQRYFDQGLILAYGFNHSEAANSFSQAARYDPNCALCLWGQALVLGPNINAPMAPDAVPVAYKLTQQASALASRTTDKEQALITALSKRYAARVLPDRRALDEAYAAAMRDVSLRFPDDAVIAALFAEALMDLHPWKFWTKRGEAQPWTGEIVSTLERALALDPNNPLANHLYIHAMEASPDAAKALPSAQRLAALVPGSGHLVHMPGHIYMRIGRYRDVILANQQAVKTDQDYLSHAHSDSLYGVAYVPHNYHFLWSAAIKTGQKRLATQAAADTAARAKQELLRDPAIGGTIQHFSLLPIYTKALFGEWDAILSETPPPADLLYPNGFLHYARGMALLRKGDADAARRELNELSKIVDDPGIDKLTIFGLNPIRPVLQIAQAVLQGEIAAGSKDFRMAILSLQKAVRFEDDLNYTEPKDWYLPPRQVLGAVLLNAGRARKAEQVYRQDLQKHPQNGWSLFGLAQSLKTQGKTVAAESVIRQFKAVWADADVQLTGSRF